MNRIVFLFLGMLMVGMSGCIKPSENRYCLEYEPAIYSLKSFQPVFETVYGAVTSQEVQSITELQDGDAILTSYCVNTDQQSSNDYVVAYSLAWAKIDSKYSHATVGGHSEADDFDLPINDMILYGAVNNKIFLGFEHPESTTKGFIYEMTYDRNPSSDIPILYCRAKVADGNFSQSSKWGNCAFDLYDFFRMHIDTETKIVRFKIHFKIGVDDDGRDLYGAFGHGIILDILVNL